MGVRKNILNNSRLVEIKEETHATWKFEPVSYEYYYFNVKLARVGFNGSKCEVEVYETFAPWAYVTNNTDKFFVKISKVEDQIHGVNIIEMDNLQAMFIEQETNLNIRAGEAILKDSGFISGNITAQGFVKMLEDNIVQAQQSMMKSMLSSTGSKLTGISASTFPVWNKKGNK